MGHIAARGATGMRASEIAASETPSAAVITRSTPSSDTSHASVFVEISLGCRGSQERSTAR